MTLLLDAGAFIAAEQRDRSMWVRLRGALEEGEPPITHGGVVGRVWRGGADRQASLAKFFQSVETLPLDETLGRQAGVLLGATGQTDVVDAALAALASHGDQIVTSDPSDLAALVAASQRRVDIVPV